MFQMWKEMPILFRIPPLSVTKAEKTCQSQEPHAYKRLAFLDNGKSIASIKALQLCRRPTSYKRRPSGGQQGRPLGPGHVD
jgi:hypothetical protein